MAVPDPVGPIEAPTVSPVTPSPSIAQRPSRMPAARDAASAVDPGPAGTCRAHPPKPLLLSHCPIARHRVSACKHSRLSASNCSVLYGKPAARAGRASWCGRPPCLGSLERFCDITAPDRSRVIGPSTSPWVPPAKSHPACQKGPGSPQSTIPRSTTHTRLAWPYLSSICFTGSSSGSRRKRSRWPGRTRSRRRG